MTYKIFPKKLQQDWKEMYVNISTNCLLDFKSSINSKLRNIII